MKKQAQIILIVMTLAGIQEICSMYINTKYKPSKKQNIQNTITQNQEPIIISYHQFCLKDLIGKTYCCEFTAKNETFYTQDMTSTLKKSYPELENKDLTIIFKGNKINSITKQELYSVATLHLFIKDKENQ